MSKGSFVVAAAFVFVIAGCAPRRPESAPAPMPPPAPSARPQPASPPLPWQNAPLSPGDWTFGDEGGAASARFGTPAAFELRCERSREISLVRAGATGGAIVVRTSFGQRSLPAAARPEGMAARLSPSDPLLDEMVFSRGRFAIEAQGVPLLILPSWPEPARVIEDCRG